MGLIPGWGTKIPHAVCRIDKIKQLKKKKRRCGMENSLVVQGLRLCTSTEEGVSSIPGGGTKIPCAM